jgi:environmental stress-induced protein Ves
MSLQRFAYKELPVTTRKDGGATTREIVSWPLHVEPDAFEWSVSIVDITASGPLFNFAGVDRTIMLLDGNAIRLQSNRFGEMLAVPHQSFSFDGEASVACTLHGKLSTNMDLMVRRGQGRAELSILEDTQTLEASRHGVLMCIEGQWRVGGGMLKHGQGVWWTEQEETWQVKPASRGAQLAIVQWWPVGTFLNNSGLRSI